MTLTKIKESIPMSRPKESIPMSRHKYLKLKEIEQLSSTNGVEKSKKSHSGQTNKSQSKYLSQFTKEKHIAL